MSMSSIYHTVSGWVRDRAINLKALTKEKLGESQEADTLFRRALAAGEQNLKKVDDNGDAHFRPAQICRRLGKTERADSYLANAKKLHYTSEAPFKTSR